MKPRAVSIVLSSLLVAGLASPALAQEEKLTGLERARQASMEAVERAQERIAEGLREDLPPGLAKKDETEKLTGRARAAAAVEAAMERGNGNGNAFGRGRAYDVLNLLIAGESPVSLDETHGEKVSAMVHAYNELKRASGDSD